MTRIEVFAPEEEWTVCSYPGCPFEGDHYHVDDADGERVVWLDPEERGS